MDRQAAKLNRFLDQQSETLSELLATQTARYMLATRQAAHPPTISMPKRSSGGPTT